MRSLQNNIITELLLKKIHTTRITHNTPLTILAKSYGISYKELTQKLKKFQIKHNLPKFISIKKFCEAADKVAPSDRVFNSEKV